MDAVVVGADQDDLVRFRLSAQFDRKVCARHALHVIPLRGDFATLVRPFGPDIVGRRAQRCGTKHVALPDVSREHGHVAVRRQGKLTP